MVMFDNIEELFQSLRDFNDYSKALVTLATATGSLLILVYFLKFCLTSIKSKSETHALRAESYSSFSH